MHTTWTLVQARRNKPDCRNVIAVKMLKLYENVIDKDIIDRLVNSKSMTDFSVTRALG